MEQTEYSSTWGDFSHPNYVVNEVGNLAQQFLKSLEKVDGLGPNLGVEVSVQWKPPPCCRYKANKDMALCLKQKRMGIGVIVGPAILTRLAKTTRKNR